MMLSEAWNHKIIDVNWDKNQRQEGRILVEAQSDEENMTPCILKSKKVDCVGIRLSIHLEAAFQLRYSTGQNKWIALR